MSPEEMKELQDAVATHSQSDVHAGRMFERLMGHLLALDERVKKLEKPKKPAVKSEEGE